MLIDIVRTQIGTVLRCLLRSLEFYPKDIKESLKGFNQ